METQHNSLEKFGGPIYTESHLRCGPKAFFGAVSLFCRRCSVSFGGIFGRFLISKTFH